MLSTNSPIASYLTTRFFALLLVFFLGFLHAFFVLGHDQFSYSQIAWLLIRIFFGSAFLGFDVADKFHPIIGPIVMTLFIGISTLILMSVLISIFNQSFGAIIDNANEEFLFLFCIKVVEYIRSDEVFEYIPPFNIVQIVILKPLRLVLPRLWSAHLNRLLMTILFYPMLLGIYLYEWFVDRRGSLRRWQPDFYVIQRGRSFIIPVNSDVNMHGDADSHSNLNAGGPQQQQRLPQAFRNRSGRQSSSLASQKSRTWELLQPSIRFLPPIAEHTVSPQLEQPTDGGSGGLGGDILTQRDRSGRVMELERKIDGLTVRFERMEELMQALVNQLKTERSGK
ncbi:hypothetical protein BC937DRAFT_94072 [Endogone sp. FLAS-F59071]|nr:hypothetical protein BC937DRAFT_94072 [Endogone sp. FLAS-F59071]|eukprot:RUS20906.1 hypothetical protein BC937DRAFT_94072 [Endogone sp. FLAS-F59071]